MALKKAALSLLVVAMLAAVGAAATESIHSDEADFLNASTLDNAEVVGNGTTAYVAVSNVSNGTAIYESKNHTVENASYARVDVMLENGTANASVLELDNGTWTEATNDTYNESGEYTLEFTEDQNITTYRVKVLLDKDTSDDLAQLHGEKIAAVDDDVFSYGGGTYEPKTEIDYGLLAFLGIVLIIAGFWTRGRRK